MRIVRVPKWDFRSGRKTKYYLSLGDYERRHVTSLMKDWEDFRQSSPPDMLECVQSDCPYRTTCLRAGECYFVHLMNEMKALDEFCKRK